MFLIARGETGDRVLDELCARVRRAVEVDGLRDWQRRETLGCCATQVAICCGIRFRGLQLSAAGSATKADRLNRRHDQILKRRYNLSREAAAQREASFERLRDWRPGQRRATSARTCRNRAIA